MTNKHTPIWDSASLEEALSIKIAINVQIFGIKFDSRDVQNGDLFIALENGYKFIQDAIDKGASIIIAPNVVDIQSQNVVLVDDTYVALLLLAQYKRSCSRAKFVAITGSAGKTSTKEIVKHFVSMAHKVSDASRIRYFANKDSYNNYIGVPISLASLVGDEDICINEIGMNHTGEIAELVKIVKPHIAIITNVEMAHLEFFSGIEEIALAKSEIFQTTPSIEVAVLNKDNRMYATLAKVAYDNNVRSVVTFGRTNDCDVSFTNYKLLNAHTSSVTIHIKNENDPLQNCISYELQISMTGEHQMYNICAAIAALNAIKSDITIDIHSIANIKLIEGRGNIIEYQDFSVINDAYNANPSSVKAGLVSLQNVASSSKIIILGDMLELGDNSKELHRSLLQNVLDVKPTKIFTFGKMMQNLYDDICSANLIHHHNIICKHYAAISNEAFDEIFNLIEKGDLLFVKSSNGTKLSKFIEYLAARNKRV